MSSANGAGRPPHEPTKQQRELVQLMAMAGWLHDVIAGVIGISDETLRKHYREELDFGNAKIMTAVVNNMVKHALGDGPNAVNAGKFLLERRGGEQWRARSEVDVTVNDGLAKQLENARRRVSESRTIN